MTLPSPSVEFEILQKRVIELAIRMGGLFLLLLWCFKIIEPFVLIITWGAIVATALHPVFTKAADLLGGRTKLAATLLALLLIGTLVAPTVMLADSLVASAQMLVDAGDKGDLTISPPPARVADWPLIGENVYDYWQRAATDLPDEVQELTPQIKAFGGWLLSTITGTGLTVLQFVVSFIIAGVFLATAATGSKAAEALATRLAGNRGREFATLTSGTIRNVAVGILGVSIVQTALLSVGFLAIDFPAAGLAALLALILCIVQVGPGLVSIPVIIYVFSTSDTTPATLFAIWTIAMTLIDSVLKPLVFGRGSTVPTLVIFLGAIGGMLMSGIIGLFVGAVVLSLGYKLYEAWLKETPAPIFADPPTGSSAETG